MAHEDIDLKNPGPNRGAAGFSDQERGKLDELLAAGFTDSFRCLHPADTGMYSWWSMRFRARETQRGLAYRLFSGQRPHCRQNPERCDPDGCDGQRPLPGGAGYEILKR